MQVKSRFSVGFYLLIALCFYTLLSRFLYAGIGSHPSKAVYFLSILIAFPISFLSFLEIFNLSRLEDKGGKVLCFSLLSLTPILFLSIFPHINSVSLSIYFTLTIIFLIILVILSKFFFENEEHKCVLTQLSAWAFSFWNAVLFFPLIIPPKYLFLLFFLVSLNDVGAYYAGKRWGSLRLFNCSPNKTVEGFLFSIAFITFISLLVALVVRAHADSITLLGKNLSPFLIPTLTPFFLILGDFGDLLFSRYKRIFNIKDYSSLLGDHGGFWDRFDSHSLVLTGSFFLIFLSLWI
ncbi:phosphatidate cytidylyltransferase [Mycoplasma haemofelis str. Langford 1]|uniref:Phosphatidate cytidylyltransferase n=2 Tax=Mycoplasma haemofelis TaxID=29501 RepID=F6FFZ0_MYCHI|nr:phosphatidate cytidylyltransferase [Mycoplasma haemofelis]AEG72456.1 putative phosphatidate cytidylyltransferase [Mycoplasma haemofelis Ohio2]CBY92143.1 phosphatidate cytidylyltransferase [Mycoplasma haemofelis str. Langford 1]